jgi:hypothetical protein
MAFWADDHALGDFAAARGNAGLMILAPIDGCRQRGWQRF